MTSLLFDLKSKCHQVYWIFVFRAYTLCKTTPEAAGIQAWSRPLSLVLSCLQRCRRDLWIPQQALSRVTDNHQRLPWMLCEWVNFIFIIAIPVGWIKCASYPHYVPSTVLSVPIQILSTSALLPQHPALPCFSGGCGVGRVVPEQVLAGREEHEISPAQAIALC